jgi:hypothetical protein
MSSPSLKPSWKKNKRDVIHRKDFFHSRSSIDLFSAWLNICPHNLSLYVMKTRDCYNEAEEGQRDADVSLAHDARFG